MKIKNIKIYGLAESLVRSGYPMQVGEPKDLDKSEAISSICNGDTNRAKKLANTPSGSGHNNFLKGIIVQFDLQYPEYFSPQLQRYHWVDIVSSQSKMHKITSRELTKDDFTNNVHDGIIELINGSIRAYNSPLFLDEKEICFKRIIENLPSGYLKWMGISTNYLQLKTIYSQRKHHKLQEWQDFCKWIETLPMSELITNKTE